MARPNVLYPWSGEVRFVGGIPSRHPDIPLDLENVYRGEVRGDPIFSDGATWVRVHVPGQGDDLLVPVENLRW